MKDKVAIVTGASQGLGHELSLQLSQLGVKVALVARTEELLQELRAEIHHLGGQAEYFICDVTSHQQVNDTVGKVVDTFGHIDILINNAGVWITSQSEVTNPDTIASAFLVNSVGPIYFSQAVTPLFEKQGHGHLIFINSVAGLDYPANKDWPVYAATKWALTGYAKALSARYLGTEIKVTSIHPGQIDTNIDKNAGDDWGDDSAVAMTAAEVAATAVYTISAPSHLHIGSMELKRTNWKP